MPRNIRACPASSPNTPKRRWEAFRDGVRANDPNGMMRTIALKMTDPEIKAVADYATGLR